MAQPKAGESGKRYWQSIDELSETPDFKEWLDREFPEGANEFTDGVSRRHFVQIMSASFVLAGLGLTGCRRPVERILPFSQKPDGYIHGVPELYATAMPTRSGGIPLVVRSNDGRPTKVEGNTLHPINRTGEGTQVHAGTDHYAQASVLSLYDPDRAMRFAKDGAEIQREVALDALGQVATKFGANGGNGLAFLIERNSSPSRARLIVALAQKYPNARWHVHEPVDFFVHQQAATMAFGRSVRPLYRYDKAAVIVSLDSDFLGSEEDTVQACRDFARGRRLTKAGDPMSRLYVIEALMTLTGANADHRLRISGGQVAAAAAALAQRVGGQAGALIGTLKNAGELNEKAAAWVGKCAEDLLKHRGKSLVVAGYKQPLAVHIAAHAINAALGNIGSTVLIYGANEENFGSLADLAQSLNSGAVDTLVIAGANPVYSAPADVDWKAAQAKAKSVIRWGYYEDETGQAANYHFPATHYLESWGDALAADGSLLAVQPLIAPLFGGITELEFFARLGGLQPNTPYDIVRNTLKEFIGNANLEQAWPRFLHDGFLANSALQPTPVAFNVASASKAAALPQGQAPSKDQLEVVFYRDYSVDDGRWNNNGWLQELPDPITKLTWENAILVSPATFKELGLKSEDVRETGRISGQVAEIDVGGRKVRGPVWQQPGQADNVVAIALGYGRSRTGRVGRNSGFNAYSVRTAAAPYLASAAKLTALNTFHTLATTQSHWRMEGRPMVREANLSQYQERPDFARHMTLEEPPHAGPLYPNPLDRFKSQTHQWGMAIDLTACVGCSACMIACQSENNVPIVGKEMVGKSREMHWLRIDRYYAGDEHDPQVAQQPMLCQHCEAAPCENVCPVNATVHDQEGLNLMIYNRCVGTRYCSNNCPWKIRRFNYFNYNKRPLDNLYQSPIVQVHDGKWELARWIKKPEISNRPELEWELVKLVKNPDVSVRMRGVMEKCTFCLQRIEQAKITQKVKAGASGDVQVPDGAFTTACAQACPADAIVFGNLVDPKSRVSQLKQSDRNYNTLEILATKPRLSYLAKIRNPNPEMPDFYEAPLTMKEYTQGNADPIKGHGPHHGAPASGHATPAAKTGAH